MKIEEAIDILNKHHHEFDELSYCFSYKWKIEDDTIGSNDPNQRVAVLYRSTKETSKETSKEKQIMFYKQFAVCAIADKLKQKETEKQYEFLLLAIPKPRMTQKDKWQVRPNVARYRLFADQLRLQAKKQGLVLQNGLSYEFHFEMPSTWSKKKQDEKLGKLHDQKPDLDNLLKSIFDILCSNDQVIGSTRSICKFWSKENKIIIKQ